MKAFVTGSTGLLGANLVHELVEAGHQVKALARSREKAERQLGDLEVEVVEGDLEDVAAFAPGLAGCDWLFHTAAYFREYYRPGDHWATLKRLNVDATLELLRAAERAGVRRAVHTSSSGVIGPGPTGRPGDEDTPPGRLAEQNLYFKSKVVGEGAIARLLEDSEIEVMLALPGLMFGPRDAAPTGTGRLVLDFCNRKLPGIIKGGANTADARDVARGMIAAAEKGRSAERYILAGEFESMPEIFATLERATSIPAPRLRLPDPVVMAYAMATEMISRVTGREPLITRSSVRAIKVHAISNDKSKRELGASYRPLAETIADEVAWFREHGYLDGSDRITAA